MFTEILQERQMSKVWKLHHKLTNEGYTGIEAFRALSELHEVTPFDDWDQYVDELDNSPHIEVGGFIVSNMMRGAISGIPRMKVPAPRQMA